MQLKLLRSLWGNQQSLDDFFAGLRPSGFEGIEDNGFDPQLPEIAQRCKDGGFFFVGQVFTSGPDTVQGHLDSLATQADKLLALGVDLIACHSGRDAWEASKSLEFYQRVVEYEKTLPVGVFHETHRGRVFFNPWITRDILKQVPSLKITADLSHWCCVCERLLNDCGDIIDLLASHQIHLHARVGHEHGPQVADPRAPEVQATLETHERWWKTLLAGQAKFGQPFMTCVPEFGPPSYQPTLPYTNVPTANLDAIIKWMAKRLQSTLASTH